MCSNLTNASSNFTCIHVDVRRGCRHVPAHSTTTAHSNHLLQKQPSSGKHAFLGASLPPQRKEGSGDQHRASRRQRPASKTAEARETRICQSCAGTAFNQTEISCKRGTPPAVEHSLLSTPSFIPPCS